MIRRAVLLASALLALVAPSASAATTKTEAESVPHAGTCWSSLSWNVLSGGKGRSCGTTNAPISWNVNVPTGESGSVTVYGFRNQYARTIRLRVDGGAWTNTTVPGGTSGVVPMASIAVSAGAHTVTMEFVSGVAVTFDYAVLDTQAATPPPPPTECSIDPPDGHAAIATAIAACPNGTAAEPTVVAFPSGKTYTQTDKIMVPDRSNIIIDGNGSTFRSQVPIEFDNPAPKPQWVIKSGTNVTLRDSVIVGNFYPSSRAKLQGNQLDHGVEVKGGNGVYVVGNTFRHIFGDAVTTVRSESMRGNATGGVASRNVHVRDNTITTMARQCVSFTELIGGSINDNRISDCHYGGIDLEINFGGQKLQDIEVARNTITGYVLFGVAVEGAVSATQVSAVGDMARINVHHNTVGRGDTCFPPIVFSDKDSDRGPISDIIVANNNVTTPSFGIGVFDVIGGSIMGNDITYQRPAAGGCGSTQTLLLPVWVKRSSGVTESGNVARGY